MYIYIYVCIIIYVYNREKLMPCPGCPRLLPSCTELRIDKEEPKCAKSKAWCSLPFQTATIKRAVGICRSVGL